MPTLDKNTKRNLKMRLWIDTLMACITPTVYRFMWQYIKIETDVEEITEEISRLKKDLLRKPKDIVALFKKTEQLQKKHEKNLLERKGCNGLV